MADDDFLAARFASGLGRAGGCRRGIRPDSDTNAAKAEPIVGNPGLRERARLGVGLGEHAIGLAKEPQVEARQITASHLIAGVAGLAEMRERRQHQLRPGLAREKREPGVQERNCTGSGQACTRST